MYISMEYSSIIVQMHKVCYERFQHEFNIDSSCQIDASATQPWFIVA